MKRDSLATAHTLSEALPYLQRYDGATVVIKFGGHAMGDDAALADFARDIVLMKQCNVISYVENGLQMLPPWKWSKWCSRGKLTKS